MFITVDVGHLDGETMSDRERNHVTAVCHVRAPLLLEPVDRQVETLQACESERAIDELLLRSWPKEVKRSTESPHAEVLETFDRFERWAKRRGVSVRPPFRERTSTSQITGETTELLVTPLLCLEVYVDEGSSGCSPLGRRGRTRPTRRSRRCEPASSRRRSGRNPCIEHTQARTRVPTAVAN